MTIRQGHVGVATPLKQSEPPSERPFPLVRNRTVVIHRDPPDADEPDTIIDLLSADIEDISDAPVSWQVVGGAVQAEEPATAAYAAGRLVALLSAPTDEPSSNPTRRGRP